MKMFIHIFIHYHIQFNGIMYAQLILLTIYVDNNSVV